MYDDIKNKRWKSPGKVINQRPQVEYTFKHNIQLNPQSKKKETLKAFGITNTGKIWED